MELNKSNKKEYDLSSIQELFNEMESPRQLADDLAQLILNYASLVTEDNIEVFKNDLSTISVLRDALIKVNILPHVSIDVRWGFLPTYHLMTPRQ